MLRRTAGVCCGGCERPQDAGPGRVDAEEEGPKQPCGLAGSNAELEADRGIAQAGEAPTAGAEGTGEARRGAAGGDAWKGGIAEADETSTDARWNMTEAGGKTTEAGGDRVAQAGGGFGADEEEDPEEEPHPQWPDAQSESESAGDEGAGEARRGAAGGEAARPSGPGSRSQKASRAASMRLKRAARSSPDSVRGRRAVRAGQATAGSVRKARASAGRSRPARMWYLCSWETTKK